jgi:hypothetical protein
MIASDIISLWPNKTDQLIQELSKLGMSSARNKNKKPITEKNHEIIQETNNTDQPKSSFSNRYVTRSSASFDPVNFGAAIAQAIIKQLPQVPKQSMKRGRQEPKVKENERDTTISQVRESSKRSKLNDNTTIDKQNLNYLSGYHDGYSEGYGKGLEKGMDISSKIISDISSVSASNLKGAKKIAKAVAVEPNTKSKFKFFLFGFFFYFFGLVLDVLTCLILFFLMISN